MTFDETITTLYSAEEISQRVAELGCLITRDYRDKDLVCIGVLKGSLPFIADLVRTIALPLSMDFLGLSSYHGQTKSSGVVRLTSDLTNPIQGKDVLIVEDIVDTGLTMGYLIDNLKTRQPRSLAICTLLHKLSQTKMPIDLDYVGFEIGNEFVVGYGLDYEEIYRNLPYIGMVDE